MASVLKLPGLSRIFCITCFLCGTNCAITFQVKKVDQEIGREVVGRSRLVRLTDRRFRIAERIQGDQLLLQLTGDATRLEIERTDFRVRYRPRKTIRYRDGDYRLRFHALAWGDDYAAESWSDYALGNLALLFPTLAVSGIVMVLDLATLPLRLIDFDRTVRTRSDSKQDRKQFPHWSPGRVVALCGKRRIVFRDGRARLPIAGLLAPPGRWRGTILCVLKTEQDTELLRHAIHLDRLALGSFQVRAYIERSQPVILKKLSAAVAEARVHFAAAGSQSKPNLASIQEEVRLRETIIDLTRYVRPRDPRLFRIREIGEDLLYLDPGEVPERLGEIQSLLRGSGF